jgi:hypothetical protein
VGNEYDKGLGLRLSRVKDRGFNHKSNEQCQSGGSRSESSIQVPETSGAHVALNTNSYSTLCQFSEPAHDLKVLHLLPGTTK